MLIENLTEDNIFVFAGIAVPANGALPVSIEMQHAVETSPLVAEYVAVKMLRIVDGGNTASAADSVPEGDLPPLGVSSPVATAPPAKKG